MILCLCAFKFDPWSICQQNVSLCNPASDVHASCYTAQLFTPRMQICKGAHFATRQKSKGGFDTSVCVCLFSSPQSGWWINSNLFSGDIFILNSTYTHTHAQIFLSPTPHSLTPAELPDHLHTASYTHTIKHILLLIIE